VECVPSTGSNCYENYARAILRSNAGYENDDIVKTVNLELTCRADLHQSTGMCVSMEVSTGIVSGDLPMSCFSDTAALPLGFRAGAILNGGVV